MFWLVRGLGQLSNFRKLISKHFFKHHNSNSVYFFTWNIMATLTSSHKHDNQENLKTSKDDYWTIKEQRCGEQKLLFFNIQRAALNESVLIKWRLLTAPTGEHREGESTQSPGSWKLDTDSEGFCDFQHIYYTYKIQSELTKKKHTYLERSVLVPCMQKMSWLVGHQW